MLKSRFRIAGEVLVIATLAGSAAAQSPRAPIDTLNDLEAALLDCWVPPPIEQSRPGMEITVLLSFKSRRQYHRLHLHGLSPDREMVGDAQGDCPRRQTYDAHVQSRQRAFLSGLPT
jgi:hypothetical protein